MKKIFVQQILLFILLLLYSCGKEDSENGMSNFNEQQRTILDSLITIYGIPNEVYLNEPGSLDYNLSLLPIDRYSITSLKIIGKINGNDVRCIHDMTTKRNLALLDLSKSQVVDGGSYSYHVNTTGGYTSREKPTKVNTITERMFDSCSGIKYIALPSSIFEIEELAFRNCSDLICLDIPSGVFSIGNNITSKCYALKKVTLPNTLKDIGIGAFEVSSIKTIRSYIEKPFAISDKTFSSDKSAILYVPKGTKQLYMNTQGWNLIKNIIEM